MKQLAIEYNGKLEEHIDEPIKKCVAGMALLGFKPIMSCCGFNYKGEKVPKKHLEKAYMYLDMEGVSEINRAGLICLALSSGWTIAPLHGSSIIDFFANTWQKGHPWNIPGCPHYHEVFVLAIAALERAIDANQTLFLPKVEIIDGNEKYKKIHKHWQYEPAEPWVVTPELYNSL